MDKNLKDAVQVRVQADCLHDAQAVAKAYDGLADAIRRDYADKNPLVLCVMLGGLVPTAELMRRLDFPFELDYLHATRYRSGTTGHSLEWQREPARDLEGRHVLVIDDILDEGHTLVAIRAALAARRPASLRVCVLAEKQHQRRAPGAQAEFIGLRVADRYVFGCGMDYREYWRQLPAIYAVKE